MVEAMTSSDDGLQNGQRRYVAVAAVSVGFLLAFAEMIIRLLAGKDVVDAVWPHALRSLDWTMTLRESAGLTVALFVLIGLGGFGLRKAISSAENPSWKPLVQAGLGLLMGLIALHFLLDVFYLRGAFLPCRP